MFIAIVVPAVKRSRPVLMVVAIAALLSCIFYYIPGLNQISSGFTIIICGVVASAIGAVLFPVRDEEEETKQQEAAV
jgi:predicted branched-subunit amino acid permease